MKKSTIENFVAFTLIAAIALIVFLWGTITTIIIILPSVHISAEWVWCVSTITLLLSILIYKCKIYLES